MREKIFSLSITKPPTEIKLPKYIDMESGKIKIALAGHTNTGKTTLIRTLMKSTVGKVDDFPNVTKESKTYFYDGIQAFFIDTPGFSNASVYNMYLDAKQEDPNFKLPKNWEQKISLDLDAIKFITESNVALYVGTLDAVPDDGYKQEISAVIKTQQKCIGILNKYKAQLQASSKDAVEKRIALWKKEFKKLGIENTVVFDAHWYQPSKIEKIYDGILEVLSSQEKSLFSEGLREFKNRQKEIRKQAIIELAKSIHDLQDIEISTKKARVSDEEVRETINRRVQSIIVRFIHTVVELYKVSAEYPYTEGAASTEF